MYQTGFTFAELLTGFRTRRKLSQRELADAVRCTSATISNWERGVMGPEDREVVLRLGVELHLAAEEVDRLLVAAGYAAQIDTPLRHIAPHLRSGTHETVDTASPIFPTGTVTFLFTDIEGSTTRWEHHEEEMRVALARHDTILRQTIITYDGVIFKTVGDAFYAAFSKAPDALEAALVAQRALQLEPWNPVIGSLPVRMALHTGTVDERDGDYFGPPLNRVARLLAAGYGGQILLSLPTQELVRDSLPEGIQLRDLGEHRLKDLIRPEQVFQVLAPDLPSDFGALRTLDSRPNNLPAQSNPLIGREQELATLCTFLRRPEVRVVTLTGAGGSGKTHLSLQVASDLLDDFADGVFFVELASVTDPEQVLITVATTLGVTELGGHPLDEIMKALLQPKQILLVLDNFEQVVGAAPIVADLLKHAPKLKVLISSREVLRLSGEQEFPVPPLALPDLRQRLPQERLTQYAAVRLFIQRAQAARPAFEVTSDNAPAVAEICVRLDGLPLAIELAAARIRVLPPATLLARLDNRLKLLTGGGRDRTTRQQTLRSTINWSYELLDGDEQQLFARLGVFVGGCTIAAAEQICNAGGELSIDVLDGLASLVDKSLLQQSVQPDGEPRFQMFETIREFALEQLQLSAVASTIRQAHADYFLALAEAAEAELSGPTQGQWLARLEREYGNLRTVLTWSLTGCETSARLASALWRYWEVRGLFTEGRRLLEEVLAHCNGISPTLWSHVLDGAATLARAQGDYTRATALHNESLALWQTSEDARSMARALAGLGAVAYNQGNYGSAEHWYQQALDLFQGTVSASRREALLVAQTLNGLGKVYREQGLTEQAARCYGQALALSRQHANVEVEAQALNNLGVLAHYQRRSKEAFEHHQQALAIRRALGDQPGEGTSLQNLGLVAQEIGEYEQAREYLVAALAIHQATGDRWEEINVWLGMGALYHFLGDLDESQSCLKQGLRLSEQIGDEAGRAYILANLGAILFDKGDLAAAEDLLRDGLLAAQALSGQAMMTSYFLSYLSRVVLQMGRPAQAIEYAESALTIRRKNDLHGWATADLATLARAHLAINNVDQAAAYARETYIALDNHGGEEAEHPHHDYYTCYRVFMALGLPEPARSALQSAFKYVMDRASTIMDPELRRSFLERVPMNREILQEATQVLGKNEA